MIAGRSGRPSRLDVDDGGPLRRQRDARDPLLERRVPVASACRHNCWHAVAQRGPVSNRGPARPSRAVTRHVRLERDPGFESQEVALQVEDQGAGRLCVPLSIARRRSFMQRAFFSATPSGRGRPGRRRLRWRLKQCRRAASIRGGAYAAPPYGRPGPPEPPAAPPASQARGRGRAGCSGSTTVAHTASTSAFHRSASQPNSSQQIAAMRSRMAPPPWGSSKPSRVRRRSRSSRWITDSARTAQRSSAQSVGRAWNPLQLAGACRSHQRGRVRAVPAEQPAPLGLGEVGRAERHIHRA